MEQRRRRGGLSGGLANLLTAVMFFVLWGSVVFGGYYFAKQYIDNSIQNVQQTNSMNIQSLESRLGSLSAGLKDIEDTLRSAGLTLTSSDSTQKELNIKIEKLDRQLQELERSLKTLKEAPNAVR